MLLGLSVTAVDANTDTAALLSPTPVVQRTAQEILSQVSSQRVELERDPQQLYALVGKDLLPHFDFDYASRLVLGPYWRSATPAQRKAFEDAFYRFLVNSYANGLLNGNYSERNLQVEPWRGSSEDRSEERRVG